MKDSVKTFLIIALAFYTMMLTAITANAQDTTCVMITLDEILYFNFYTSEVIDRKPNQGITTLKVKDSEVLCLHLYDEKRRYRDVTTIWEDGDHRHDIFESKDDVYFTPYGLGSIDIEISPARRRKKNNKQTH